ncbi:MAG: asparagine synthase-related protein, partial [Nanoarchaeota archaeon]|nr:asparagine synthase-related protein [Nanoarchaeota archaeon]
ELDDSSEDLLSLLRKSVSNFKDFQVVLASGGIDSSIIAKLLNEFNSDVQLITCGTENSEDLFYARILAKSMGKELIEVKLDEKKVEETIRALRNLKFGTYDILLGIVEYNALNMAYQLGFRKIVTGAGSDEAFFGYSLYKGMEPKEANRYRLYRVSRLSDTDILRMHILADRFGEEIGLPYLDESVLGFAFKNVHKYDGKASLRRIAEEIKLPGDLINRGKKAMQYGSGVTTLLESLSRSKGFNSIPALIKEV